MRLVLLFGTVLFLAGCATTEEAAVAPGPAPAINPLEHPAAELALWMEGAFSSATQAAADPAYAPLALRVVPIWPGRADGPWLYIEQTESETPDAPYRQRIVRLQSLGPGAVTSDVYALPGNGQDYIGAWRRSRPFAELSPEDLDYRDGCTVFLERQPNRSYVGATRGQTCVSRLRRASYATSEVAISQEGMTIWDRGFNNAGTQVWGAEAGPYRFDRVED